MSTLGTLSDALEIVARYRLRMHGAKRSEIAARVERHARLLSALDVKLAAELRTQAGEILHGRRRRKR